MRGSLAVDDVELGGVELLVEIGTAVVGDVVEAPRDAHQKPVFGKLRTAVPSVTGRGATQIPYRSGCEVPVFADKFKNGVVRRDHPVRLFTHVVRGIGCYFHMATDYQKIVTTST